MSERCRCRKPQALLGATLNLFDALQDLGVERMILFETGKLGGRLISRRFLHDLSQLSRLVISLDVLESKSHLNTLHESLHIVAHLGQLSCGTNESLLATEFSKGCATNTDRNILKVGVGDTGDDSVDVLLLFFLGDAVLVGDEMCCLFDRIVDFFLDLRVCHCLVDSLDSLIVTEVGGGGVRSVDSEELSLDEWLEVLDPVNALDVGMARLEAGSLDAPLVEGLDENVEAAISWLSRDDAIDGRVAELGLGREIFEDFWLHVLLIGDDGLESISSVDHVLTGDDSEWLGGGSLGDAIGDGLGDEFENGGTNGAGDDGSFGDSIDDLFHVIFGVDGSVVIDRLLLCALCTNFSNRVGRGVIDLVDEIVNNIDEDDFVASLVHELGDEATADVTTAEVHSCATHGCG